MKVFITDATYKHSIALARYLKQFDPKLEITGISPYKPLGERFFARCYDQWEVGDFLEIAAAKKPDLLVPVGSASVEGAAIAAFDFCTLPKNEAVEIALDKSKTLKLAEKLSIPIPKTLFSYDLNALRSENLCFPCVVKGTLEAGKNVVCYPKNKNELLKAVDSALQDKSQRYTLPLIQEYVKGVGLGFFAFYQQGVLKRFYMHKRLREYPVTGGASTAAETIYHQEAFEHGKKLLDALSWNGPAMVEFKYDPETNRLALMEINPKFWGSTELGLAAGVNFGELLVRDKRGEDLKANLSQDQYEKTRFFWPFDGDLSAIVQSRQLFALKDYFGGDYKTNFKTYGLGLSLIRLVRQLASHIRA